MTTMTMMPTTAGVRESDLLTEVAALANRARDLRRIDAVRNHAEIRLVTGDLQAKWVEIRALRAPPVSEGLAWRSRGGSHR